MNRTAGVLSLAALGLAFLIPAGAAAQSATNPQMNENSSQNGNSQSSNSMSGQSEASQMVPARADLDHTLDAKNAKPGHAFEARLLNKVHLKDGQDLPRGTTLVGKVGQDDMNENGRSKLALCFDQAKLKDGKTVPIKATILGIYNPGSQPLDFNVAPGEQVPNDWNHKVLQVDQIGAVSGADLHSKIGSQNSGVLVSSSDDDIRLRPGTELTLAIASQNQSESRNGGSGGE